MSGAAVGGQGMTETDKKVCMVEDMTELSPLAEAYARARGIHQTKDFISYLSQKVYIGNKNALRNFQIHGFPMCWLS